MAKAETATMLKSLVTAGNLVELRIGLIVDLAFPSPRP